MHDEGRCAGRCVRTLVRALACALLLGGCTSVRTQRPPTLLPPAAEIPGATAPGAVEPPRLSPEAQWAASADPIDLWDRIRAGYGLPRIEHPRVQEELARYARQPYHLDQITERAARFLHHIVEEIERRDMPMEFALLPVVESAYDPLAYSHGRAAGLWQFIPSTGRLYALDQDWWHDERRDVLEATRAALEYLEDLHALYDGDWLLALAAYNSGAGNVNRALRQDRARGGDGSDFFALGLPRETRAYVPRLLALARLVEDPAAHGLRLESVPDLPAFEVVPTGSQIALARAAELADVDEATLRALNPALNRWATHPDGPHRLLVPMGHGDRLGAALAELPADARLAWTRHRIRPGEALSLIAERHGVDVETIQRANRLRGTRIRAGDALLIPVAEGRGAPQLAVSDAAMASQAAGTTHRVRAGESFWSIARRHGMDMAALAAANGLRLSDTLRPGQTLALVGKTAAAERAPGSAPADPSMIRELAYRVRRGDSLWTIARRFDLTLGDIVDWNRLDPERILRPGQRLRLFVDITGG